MTHITKLTEIIDGRLLPSDKKLSASLLEVDAGRLTVSENTLGFDATGLATETFVTNAIANAQLEGGEVDLSGYATKDDLASKTSVVDVQALIDNYNTTVVSPGIETITQTLGELVVDEIAAIVDGAPETFDTLKEIAEWIENDGVAATDLAANLADKVDKVEGKGLSTEDFTTDYKSRLDNLDEEVLTLAGDAIRPTIVEVWRSLGEADQSIENLKEGKLDTPTPFEITPTLINSIPLYSINNGEYVLCTPEVWLNVGGYLVPGYSPSSLSAVVFDRFIFSAFSSFSVTETEIYSFSDANFYIDDQYVGTVNLGETGSPLRSELEPYGVSYTEVNQRIMEVRNNTNRVVRIRIESVDERAIISHYEGLGGRNRPGLIFNEIGIIQSEVYNRETNVLVHSIEATLTPSL